MNQEFWNEIGNLYYMCGAYESAINAYLRAIKLDNTFGRPYSNLALAYVQTGKYAQAIELYRRSIELLADKQEKATTWNRLGILYRMTMEYDNALEAYQRADLLMPQDNDGTMSDIRREVKLPLTVSLPEIDLDAVLAKGQQAMPLIHSQLLMEINAEFEMAEAQDEGSGFVEELSEPGFENFFRAEDLNFELVVGTQNEEKPVYLEATAPIEKSVYLVQDAKSEQSADSQSSDSTEAPIVDELSQLQTNAVSIPETTVQLAGTSEAGNGFQNHDVVTDMVFFENDSHDDSLQLAISETGAEAIEYSQADYLLADLSPEEKLALEMEIIKYQQATSKHPRSYILWESLGEAYKSAGQYKNAIQAFQKAITMNPTNAMCHYRLGLVLAAERKEQEAINSFKRVLELDPNSAQAHASLASQYRKMGLTVVAQEHIEKVRGMQFDGESDYNHACLEAICGNNERALELLEVALQSKQTYVTWAQNDPDFDSLRKDHRFQMLLSSHAGVE